jgi:putative tricarboxylic transport membrane protein
MWVKLLKIKSSIMSTLIVLLTIIGVYSVNNGTFDIFVMLFFGFVGYLLRKFNFEDGPMALAFVLGPMIENALRQSLLLSSGDPSIFVTRPISATLLVIFVLLVIGQTALFIRKKKQANVQVSC